MRFWNIIQYELGRQYCFPSRHRRPDDRAREEIEDNTYTASYHVPLAMKLIPSSHEIVDRLSSLLNLDVTYG